MREKSEQPSIGLRQAMKWVWHGERKAKEHLQSASELTISCCSRRISISTAQFLQYNFRLFSAGFADDTQMVTHLILKHWRNYFSFMFVFVRWLNLANKAMMDTSRIMTWQVKSESYTCHFAWKLLFFILRTKIYKLTWRYSPLEYNNESNSSIIYFILTLHLLLIPVVEVFSF